MYLFIHAPNFNGLRKPGIYVIDYLYPNLR